MANDAQKISNENGERQKIINNITQPKIDEKTKIMRFTPKEKDKFVYARSVVETGKLRLFVVEKIEKPVFMLVCRFAGFKFISNRKH